MLALVFFSLRESCDFRGNIAIQPWLQRCIAIFPRKSHDFQGNTLNTPSAVPLKLWLPMVQCYILLVIKKDSLSKKKEEWTRRDRTESTRVTLNEICKVDGKGGERGFDSWLVVKLKCYKEQSYHSEPWHGIHYKTDSRRVHMKLTVIWFWCASEANQIECKSDAHRLRSYSTTGERIWSELWRAWVA